MTEDHRLLCLSEVIGTRPVPTVREVYKKAVLMHLSHPGTTRFCDPFIGITHVRSTMAKGAGFVIGRLQDPHSETLKCREEGHITFNHQRVLGANDDPELS